MKNISYLNVLNVTIVGSSASGFVCMSLLDASIKSLLLLALATVTALALVRASAATRHMIWGTTMIGLLLMPACAMLLPQWRVLPSWLSLESRFEQQSDISEPLVYNAPASDGRAKTEPDFAPDPAQYETTSLPIISDSFVAVESTVQPAVIRMSAFVIVGIWTIGFSLCLLPIAFALLRLRHTERILHKNPPLSNRIVRHIATLAKELDVKPPRILVGPPGAMPMVWSLRGSRMLLPIDIEHWSANRIKSVLLHELVHLKRRDPTWFLVGLLARAVNWFNPLAWYAVHRLRLECEQACDDHVLRMGVEASEYASHLLALSTSVRAASGTSSMALAMASKPSVENRIVSILDTKKNRCAVTLRRASAMLFTVTACVVLMAILAATGSDKTIANAPTSSEQDEVVTIKYPHCIVEVDNLKPRSLAEAIAAFNRESLESPTGSAQAPITEQETLVAISEFVKLEHVPDATKAVFREIAETKTVPANAYFRRFTRFDDERQMHGVWCVRLYLEATNPPVYSVPIRTTSLYVRPYTQLERKQNAEGFTLLNRFASYFESQPTERAKDVVAKEATDRLKIAFQKAVYANKLDDAMELYHWEGANDSLRDFVASELKTLFKARALSIKFGPSRLDGKQVHWSAYQHFQPNLPIVGYMHIRYTPQDEVANANGSVESHLLDHGDILAVYVEGVFPGEAIQKAPVSNDPSTKIGKSENAPNFPILVQKKGTIMLPLIAPIMVKGKSIAQAAEFIKQAYLDAKLLKPEDQRMPIVTLIGQRISFPSKTLSLELGKLGNELRFVNYVAFGDRKLPEGPVAGLSIRGNMEKLADGTYLQTEVISNPGSLISGHLANEEIRQRDLENTNRNVGSYRLAIRGQHEKTPADMAFETAKEELRKKKLEQEARVQKLEAEKQKIIEKALEENPQAFRRKEEEQSTITPLGDKERNAKKNFEAKMQKFEAMARAREEEAQTLTEQLILNQQLRGQLQDIPAFQGKISNIESDGETLFIDIGKAKGMRPGVLFSVFDQDAGRKKLWKPKAVVEVVAVLTRDLSRCKVVSKIGSESIAKGDGIYSAVWKPAPTVFIALVGKMDINGDGKDDREEVTKLIESEGGKVVNELTPETRWLVTGTEIDQADPLIEKAKLMGISRINYDKLLRCFEASGVELQKK